MNEPLPQNLGHDDDDDDDEQLNYYDNDGMLVLKDLDSDDSMADTESHWFPHCRDGCYFPYCLGGLTILYIIYAVLVSLLMVPGEEANGGIAVRETVEWTTDFFLAFVLFVLGIQLCCRSDKGFMASLAFGSWSYGYLASGLSLFLYGQYGNVTEESSSSEAETTGCYYLINVATYILWMIAIFWTSQLLQLSWNVIYQVVLEERSMGEKSWDGTLKVPKFSWINSSRLFTAIAYIGAAVTIAGCAWTVYEVNNNQEWEKQAKLPNETIASWSSTSTDVVKAGENIFLTGTLLFFIAAAIIWRLHAELEEVSLPDFFVPTTVAAPGILWLQLISGVYRIILVCIDKFGYKNVSLEEVDAHRDIVGPFLLKFMTLATFCLCHNLLLSFFPSTDWREYDEDDDRVLIMTKTLSKWEGVDVETNNNIDEYEGVECVGYHYESQNPKSKEQGSKESMSIDQKGGGALFGVIGDILPGSSRSKDVDENTETTGTVRTIQQSLHRSAINNRTSQTRRISWDGEVVQNHMPAANNPDANAATSRGLSNDFNGRLPDTTSRLNENTSYPGLAQMTGMFLSDLGSFISSPVVPASVRRNRWGEKSYSGRNDHTLKQLERIREVRTMQIYECLS
jgi:hypothetical protein